jgi:predicted Fe-S protein YdhL (DUF1289 family)
LGDAPRIGETGGFVSDEKPVASPCNKVCSLDAATGLCVGCLRNIDEIAGWTAFTDEQRARILAELPRRRERLERGRRSGG